MSRPPTYKSEVARLFEEGEILTYTKGQIVMHAHEDIHHMYRIVDGFMKVYTINSRGEEQLHVVYGPGDIFPLTVLIGDDKSNIFYQTMTSCEISRLPLALAIQRLNHDSELSYATLQQSIEQYKVYATRIFTLEYRYARERLAHRLLVLARRFGKRTDSGIELQTPLTQQVIASSINLSRETVSREMERFVHKGYLKETSRSGGPIVILNPQGLGSELPGGPQYFTNPDTL